MGAGCVGCRSSDNAGGWGQSALKLTSRVFSALTDIGGSFVSVQDGGILATGNGSVAAVQDGRILSTRNSSVAGYDGDDSEPAEDAVLNVGGEETDRGVDSVPTVELDPSDVVPVQVAVRNSDDIVRLFSTLAGSEGYADLAHRSFSSESGSQTTDEPAADKRNDDQDDNIVFSSGSRRKIRQTKQPKGKNALWLSG